MVNSRNTCRIRRHNFYVLCSLVVVASPVVLSDTPDFGQFPNPCDGCEAVGQFLPLCLQILDNSMLAYGVFYQ
jgi:hypothetical protein